MTWLVKASRPRLSTTFRCSSPEAALEQVRRMEAFEYPTITVTSPSGADVLVAELEAAIASARAGKEAAARKEGGVGSNLRSVGHLGRAVSMALRQEKARRLAAELAPIISEIRAEGASSLRQIAASLDARGIQAPRGGKWGSSQVRRIIASLDEAAKELRIRDPEPAL